MSPNDERHPASTSDGLPASGGGLVGVAVRNPVFTTMLMAGMLVLGLFSLRRLPIDELPDVSIPVVSVQTTYPGASPEVVEREVTRRIEEAVNPTRGVDTLTSVSLDSVSLITVQFDLGTDIDAATADVRSKIEQIRRQLPEGIDPPIVQQFDPADQPILSLALASETRSPTELTELADGDVRRTLEGVGGVGRVQITGGSRREVHVLLDPEAMQGLDLAVPDVMAALQYQNLEIAAGRIEQGNREELVRVMGRIQRPEQFERIIVAQRGGQFVRLSQIAEVRDASEEARSLALVNGRPAVGIDLLKVAGSNTVDVADGVARVVERLAGSLGDEVSLTVVRDNSVSIRQSVASVQEELLMGAALTVFVVFLFLNDGRATAITSLSLPVSVVSTFILLDALGFTLNILTLMALSLSIGIVVDDAIVVIENVVRHRQMGADARTAAYRGTTEIFLAVMAATLTIVAVFVPVAFMGGIIGKFFYEFGLTVAWAVLVSLFVSFTLTPMLSAWWPGRDQDAKRPRRGPVAAFNRAFDRVTARYEGLVAWVLQHRRTTLAVAGLSFAAAIGLFPLVGGEFSPAQDRGEFSVAFETPADASMRYTESKAHEIGRALRALPEVVFTYTSVGAGVTGTVNRGDVYVRLLPRGERERGQQELMVAAREALAGLYGVEASVLIGAGMGGLQKPIQVALRGPDAAVLGELAEGIAGAVHDVPGAIEVQSSLGDPKPEVRLLVDIDRANDLGLNASAIAGAVQPLLAGQTATTWEDPGGEEHDVVVRLPLAARTTPERIGRLPIAIAAGGAASSVPLGQVARLERGFGPAQIDRESLARVVTVAANVGPERSLAEVSGDVQGVLDAWPMPEGYSARMGGDTEQLEETTSFVLESLLLAVIMIYLILASQFGSFVQPVAIMLSLPLSLVGVMLGLLVTGDTLNIMSMIGIILLMGLVTKNAILLVESANQRRAAGATLVEAVAKAGATRLRPIVMTTLATIFGMVPIALGLGDGGEFRAPMARAVIGGLLTSTLLTLLVVPVVYTYLEQGAAWLGRLLGGREQVPGSAPPAGAAH